jgi:hypothetical protein
MVPGFAVEALALLLGAAALLLAVPSLLGAVRAARMPVAPQGTHRPFASIICPARGEQQGLEQNALAIATQDYPEHEVLFVVDALDDPCVPALRRAQAQEPRIRLVVADPARTGPWPTGKMVALLTGVHQVHPRSTVLAFADADGRPGPRWLASLVEPLADARVGAVSGFRWYHAAERITPWTLLRDAWDHTGLGAMTAKRLRLVWGGSLAVRKEDFLRGPVLEEWRKGIADDVGLARAMEAMDLRMVFAPGAMAASPEDGSPRAIREFMVRQMAILRSSHPEVYRLAMALHGSFVALLLLGAPLAALGPTPLLRAAGWMMLSPWLVAVPRAWLRERLVLRALPALRARPRRERWPTLALALATSWVMLAIHLQVRRTRAVTWRGRRYGLGPPADPSGPPATASEGRPAAPAGPEGNG